MKSGIKMILNSLFKMVPVVILVVLLDGLAWLLIGGNFQSFLHPRFMGLLIVSSVIIIGFIASFIIGGNPFSFGALGQNALRSFILFIPILFMYTVSGQQFGVHALNKKMVGNERESLSLMQSDAAEPNELKPQTGSGKYYEVTVLDIARKMKELNGKNISSKGLIFKKAEIIDGKEEVYTMLFRFVIVCCAADAMPVWVYVETGDLPDIANESWVEVGGTLEVKKIQGNDVPVIYADSMKNLGAPGPGEQFLFF